MVAVSKSLTQLMNEINEGLLDLSHAELKIWIQGITKSGKFVDCESLSIG